MDSGLFTPPYQSTVAWLVEPRTQLYWVRGRALDWELDGGLLVQVSLLVDSLCCFLEQDPLFTAKWKTRGKLLTGIKESKQNSSYFFEG